MAEEVGRLVEDLVDIVGGRFVDVLSVHVEPVHGDSDDQHTLLARLQQRHPLLEAELYPVKKPHRPTFDDDRAVVLRSEYRLERVGVGVQRAEDLVLASEDGFHDALGLHLTFECRRAAAPQRR